MKNERENNNRTILLYETDGMMTEFDATVTASSTDGKTGRDYVELDRTAFFPEGGGQKADTGTLVSQNGDIIRVSDVQTVDGCVRHYVERPVAQGSRITGKLDAKQRFSRMQNHGAEHLVCGLIHKMFGYDNVGFHMTDEGLVIDINGPLTAEQISAVEERANEIVFENVPVTVSFPTQEEAELIPYRSKIDELTNLRLVTIEGYDVCACCAPHVRSTGQFGSIKILSFVPHRKGTRLTMIAGMDAYRDHVMLHDNNSKIMEILSAGRDKTGEAVREYNDRYTALKEDNASLRRSLSHSAAMEVIGRLRQKAADTVCPEIYFTDILDPVGLRNLVNECTGIYSGPVCAFLGNDTEGYRYIMGINEDSAENSDIRKLVGDFNEKCMGKGGGSNIMVQGTSRAKRKDIEKYFASVVQNA